MPMDPPSLRGFSAFTEVSEAVEKIHVENVVANGNELKDLNPTKKRELKNIAKNVSIQKVADNYSYENKFCKNN